MRRGTFLIVWGPGIRMFPLYWPQILIARLMRGQGRWRAAAVPTGVGLGRD